MTVLGLKIPAGDTAMIEMMRKTEAEMVKVEADMKLMKDRGYAMSMEQSTVGPRLPAGSSLKTASTATKSVAATSTIRRSPPPRRTG